MPGNMAAAYVGRCYATFIREVGAGELPKATKSGLWDKLEIDAYLDGRNKVRDPVEDTKRRLEEMYG